MKQTIIILLIGVLVSCTDNNIKKDSFTFRVHKSSLEIDHYELIGEITKENFIREFEKINWDKEYLAQINEIDYNVPSIEVMDNLNFKYLSISIGPNTFESGYFVIGLGKHSQSKNKIERIVKLYNTKTNDKNKIIEFIKIFFSRDTEKLKKKVQEFEFLDEIEDLYINTK